MIACLRAVFSTGYAVAARRGGFIAVLALVAIALPAAAGTLVPASGGEAIPSETAGGAYTELTGPVYEEATRGEIGTGTIVLQLPEGFEWDTSTLPTMLVEKTGRGGANINRLDSGQSVTASAISAREVTFEILQSSTGGNNRNRITFENLRVRPQQVAPEASGHIVHAGNSVISNVQTGATSWGYLEQTPLQGNVFLTANGEWESPVTVVVGEALVLEATVFNCPTVTPWRDTWNIDGNQAQAQFAGDPCGRSPISRTEVFTEPGTYEVTFRADARRCFWLICWWNAHGEDSVTIQVSSGAEPIDANMVLEYRMEAAGWDGSAGEVRDTSGNAYHGFSEAGAAVRITDPANPADPGTCRYADVTGTGRLQGPVPVELRTEGEFSIAAWIRMGPDSNASILALGDLTNGYAERFELYQNGTGQLAARFRYQSGDDVVLTAPSGAVFNNNWQHVAVTRHFESAGGNTTRVVERLYINGNITDSESREYPPGQWPFNALLHTASGDMHLAGFPGSVWAGSLLLDELRLYAGGLTEVNVEEVMSMVNPCGYPAAFVVQVPPIASVCAPAEIVIGVVDSYGELVPHYDGVAQLSTSSGRGQWDIIDGNGTLNGGADNGIADYAFVEADGGAVTLALSNQSADDIVIHVFDADWGISGSSDGVSFRENAFELAASDNLGNDVVAGRPHALRLRALRQDPDSGQCGLNAQYDGAVNLKLWLNRSDEDPAGAAPEIAGQPLPDVAPASDNIGANFTAGEAELALDTADVGQYRLMVLDNTSGRVEDESGALRPVEGGSTLFTVRPFGFAVDSIAMNSKTNPGGSTPAGAIFGPAGTAFGLRVLAVTHQPNNDMNDDGVPDADATLSPAGVTPAFAGSGELTVGDFAPSQGFAGGLTGATFAAASFNGGIVELPEVRYSEVGAVSLQAEATGYLGMAASIVGRSPMIGRFTPAQLSVTVNNPFLATACTSFSYLGQPLEYETAPEITIRPLNARGAQTRNYADFRGAGGDNWWRILTDIQPSYEDGNRPSGVGLDHSLAVHSPGAHQPTAAVAEVTLNFGGQLQYVWQPAGTSAPLVPPFESEFSVSFALRDADGVGYDDGEGGETFELALGFDQTAEQRHGRLRAPNAHGSELLDLNVPLGTQYYAGENQGGFVNNTADACTQDLRLTLAPAGFSCAFEDGGTNHTGIGCGEAKPGRNWMEPMIGGSSNLWLRAPGAGNTGKVELGVDSSAANLPTWLRFDWDNDGQHDDWPSALITFGIYGGNDRQIERRERW